MYARLFVTLSVHALLSYCAPVNLQSQAPEIISKSKIELTPILITGGLNDIVALSAPAVDAHAVYYLQKPNGDALRINFEKNTTDGPNFNVKHLTSYYRIFNANNASGCGETDVVGMEEAKMGKRDFMIGPLDEEDHGNWVLSAYFTDTNGDWVEFFQVITVEIIETVPLTPDKTQLDVGDTYILSFASPITDLESCQIGPPTTTVDRFYDRRNTDVNMCEFIMTNVTLADEGIWTIIGVGRIVYKGTAYLHIRDNLKYR